MRFPNLFVGGFAPTKRPSFEVDAELERKAELARKAMGDSYLLAKPVNRKDRRPVDFERLPV